MYSVVVTVTVVTAVNWVRVIVPEEFGGRGVRQPHDIQ